MKRITDEQILGEKGVNLIQSIVLDMGFLWHGSNLSLEAGVDGWVELRDENTGEVGNCWLAVQSKARTQLDEDESSVKLYCKQKDIEYWMQGSQPVILIVSKPTEKLAWWVSVKDYLAGKDIQSGCTIQFDKKIALLTPSTREDWKALGNRYGSGTYFTPIKCAETLSSNLLRVSRMSSVIFTANTEHDSNKKFGEALRKAQDYPPNEWGFGKDNRLHSFHDLGNLPWSKVCDTSSIEELDTESIAYSDDDVDRKCFVKLLNGCFSEIVRQFGMRYSAEGDCYYFSPNKESVTRTLHYKSRKVKAKRGVVKRYFNKKDNDKIAYYRHVALSHRFFRFADFWYLLIDPTYVFTTDGKQLDPYREEHLSKIISIEGDGAVSGYIVMFADILKDRDDLVHKSYEHLGFDGIETATVVAGIDDEAWARIKSPKTTVETSVNPDFGAGIFSE